MTAHLLCNCTFRGQSRIHCITKCYVLSKQISPSPDKKKVTPETLGLVEVGPRVTLNPIKILEGSFGGPVIYSNPDYVSPNLVSHVIHLHRTMNPAIQCMYTT